MSSARMTNSGNYDRLNERLNHVENQVASIGTKVENLQEDITGLVDSFNNYVDVSNKQQKTDWGTIAAWATVAIMCVSALLYHNRLTLAPLELTNQYQQKEIDRQQSELDLLKNNATTDNSL